MKEQKMNFKLLTAALLLLFASLVVYGGYSVFTYGNRWFASSTNTRVRSEKANVIAGDILDRNGVVLATTNDGERVYQSDEESRKAVVHLLGDNLGHVSNGVESFQASYLLGFHSSLAERVLSALRGETRRGDDLTLTADSKLCTFISQAFQSLDKSAGKSGAAVVMNYQTGEVLALVSLPNFDPHTISQEVEDDPEKPFWNRALQSVYPPGSTFKIITTASALKNLQDIQSRVLSCDGHLKVMDQEIHDAGKAVHGSLSLEKAFTLSCNNIFAALALELGDDKLRAAAESFGFNENFLFRDLVVENSAYPTANRNLVEVAWSGAGQSQVQSTPLHMCMVAAAVANHGVMMEPRLILSAQSPGGVTRAQLSSKVFRKALPEGTAEIIKDYMRKVVLSGTGTRAQVPGLSVCGKTGSAESAKDGRDVTHGWFVGFIEDESLPYAAAVIVEDVNQGDGGGTAAAPIAQKIFEYLKKNY